jgi:hypothetical protein
MREGQTKPKRAGNRLSRKHSDGERERERKTKQRRGKVS